MDLQEIRNRREALEKQIASSIFSFEKETGCTVSSVELEYAVEHFYPNDLPQTPKKVLIKVEL